MHDDPPLGAIYNGSAFLQSLVDWYDFECQGGKLANCYEFQQAWACFNAMADWINNEAANQEPSEAAQGLTPIPDGYKES